MIHDQHSITMGVMTNLAQSVTHPHSRTLLISSSYMMKYALFSCPGISCGHTICSTIIIVLNTVLLEHFFKVRGVLFFAFFFFLSYHSCKPFHMNPQKVPGHIVVKCVLLGLGFSIMFANVTGVCQFFSQYHINTIDMCKNYWLTN